MIERLDRQLSLCEPGCMGRCQECPDDVIRDVKAELTRLREERDVQKAVIKRATVEIIEAHSKGFEECREKAAGAVPSNWLDSLLTGPNNKIGNLNNANAIEGLLTAVRERIRSLSPETEGQRRNGSDDTDTQTAVPCATDAAAQAPDGWQLVPKAETHEMRYAMDQISYRGYGEIWKAALAAAPEFSGLHSKTSKT